MAFNSLLLKDVVSKGAKEAAPIWHVTSNRMLLLKERRKLLLYGMLC